MNKNVVVHTVFGPPLRSPLRVFTYIIATHVLRAPLSECRYNRNLETSLLLETIILTICSHVKYNVHERFVYCCLPWSAVTKNIRNSLRNSNNICAIDIRINRRPVIRKRGKSSSILKNRFNDI